MSTKRTTPVTIVGRSTELEIGGRIEVEWELSERPAPAWAEVFQMAAPDERDGPVDWVMGGGPDVIEGTVRWFVPAAELDAADREVHHRLEVANGRLGSAAPAAR
jgi:hypothetical protein